MDITRNRTPFKNVFLEAMVVVQCKTNKCGKLFTLPCDVWYERSGMINESIDFDVLP